MNTNDNLYPTSANELIRNFSDMVRNFEKREQNWKSSKEEYDKKIYDLTKKIKIHENINTDLLKRVKMLEYELQRHKESKKNKINKNEIIFKDPQYKNIIKDDDLSYMDDFGSSNKSSIINILKNIGINERLANNLFIDFELNKPELETLIKKDIEQKFLENDNYTNINIKDDKKEKKNLSFTKYAELNSHFDEVRKLAFLENINSLVSVSEDCLIKVWSLNNIMYNSQNGDIEPYLNLRGHTGPLFCVEHGKDNLIYTGGNEGIIRIWNILPQSEINSLSSYEELINLNLGFFQNDEENEMFWDLKHHPKDNLLVSLSSHANINFWETTSANDFVQAFNKGKTKWCKSTKYKKSCYINDENAIPICCEFMKQDNNKLIIGFNDVTLSLLDINKNTFISHYNLLNYNYYKKTNNKNINRILLQPNCLVCYNSIPCVFAGFEDSTIKLLDFRNNIPSTIISNIYNKEIVSDSIKGHDDSVTSLNLYKDLYLFSTSHDGNIKLWDVRRLNEPIDTFSTKQKKWDESIWHSILVDKSLTLYVACADSTIKVFKL
jgi:WD40 repeat protein